MNDNNADTNEDSKESKPMQLTLDQLRKILESPTHLSNQSILTIPDFITQSRSILSSLSPVDRFNFLNSHLDERRLKKWHSKKKKIMKVKQSSFQHTALTVSFSNFTYAHTNINASKIWFDFIEMIVGFDEGFAECDLTHCDAPNCIKHITVIDQLYAYINTSDDSLYGISTQEFSVRNGFRLLMRLFNKGGINGPIPPIILHSNQFSDERPFLAHFKELNYDYLYCIPPNELRSNWLKDMLRNGHPIFDHKANMDSILNVKFKDEYDKNDCNGDVEAFLWVMSALPNLLKVRHKQKQLLLHEFARYEDTQNNAVLIDTMLDFLYWSESYIHQQLVRIAEFVLRERNQIFLFHFIKLNFGNMSSMAVFMQNFMDLHVESNKNVNTLSVLFENRESVNNKFYFECISVLFENIGLVSMMDKYLPFLTSKVVKWHSIDQQTFDIFLDCVLNYVDRFVSEQSVINLMLNRKKLLSEMLRVKKEKQRATVMKWLMYILELMGKSEYVQQIVYHLCKFRFRFPEVSEQIFVLQLLEKIVAKFEVHVVGYFMHQTINTRIKTVIRNESILWLLCRCCFDEAIAIFLDKGIKSDNVFETKWIEETRTFNNVFLCLSQSKMRDSVTHTKEMEIVRVKIFKMLCDWGMKRKLDVKKALLSKDSNGANGKNAIEYALENGYQSLHNEMKLFVEC